MFFIFLDRLMVGQVTPEAEAVSETNSKKPTFSLLLLFYLTAVYAAGLVFGPWTILLTTIVMVFWWVWSKNYSVRRFLLLLAILLLLIGMFLPAVSQVREAARRIQCMNNVRQLTLAILNYESAHGRLISAIRRIPAQPNQAVGKPPVSWRVTILPFIEEQNLYDRYRFDEPWDGPNNIKLLKEMPYVFGCPSHEKTEGHTHYKLVADKGSAFEPGRAMTYADISDGTSNTLCIVEDVSNQVPWTKPEDLTVEEAIQVLAPIDPRNVAHVSDDGFATRLKGSNVSLLDGACYLIGPTIDPETVRNLCLCADGKLIAVDDLGDSAVVVHYERYVALAIYIVLLLLPGVYLRYSK